MGRKSNDCKYCGAKTSNSRVNMCNKCIEKLRLIRTIKRMLGGSDGQKKKDL